MENKDSLLGLSEALQTLTQASLRATAISMAEYLNAELEDLLQAFLIDDASNVKRLLSGELAPLGTFSARITVAFALGLISEKERKNLILIRKIRNVFAHALPQMELSFDSPEIKSSCQELEIPQPVDGLPITTKNVPFADDRASRYFATCAFLLFVLIYRQRNVTRQRKAESITEEMIRLFIPVAEGS